MSLSKKSKIFLLFIVLAIIGAYAAYKYAYKPHKTIESQKATFVGSSDDFLIKVKENPDSWQNTIVEITGKITNSDENGVTLSHQIYCQFKDNQNTKTLQETITIKGQVIGYDDLLEELKLNQCIIIQ